MKVTYSDIKSTFPEEKKSIESIYGLIIPVRKISYLVTIPFLWLKISAFAVSVISIFVAFTGCVLIAIPNNICRIVGVILIPIWHLLDCVDGNIARYTKTASPLGAVVDGISGYYCYAFLPIALGIAAFNIENNFLGLDSSWFLIFGGIASVSNLLARIIYQKYANGVLIYNLKNNIINENHPPKKMSLLQNQIAVNLAPVGLPMFALFLSPILNLYNILVIYYCAYYFSSLLFFTIVYLRKCKNFGK